MFKKAKIRVSVCIPVCGTEKYLADCLESVALQDFEGVEIIVVDDGGVWNAGRKSETAKQILKEFCKAHKKQKFLVNFIKHEKNKGLVETRRSAVFEANGDFIIFLDSDDTLPLYAIRVLYENAEKTGADIVHGKASVDFRGDEIAEKSLGPGRCGVSPLEGVGSNEVRASKRKVVALKFDREQEVRPRGSLSPLPDSELERRKSVIGKKVNKVFFGELEGKEVFDGFLVKNNHCGFLWGKIYKRELCVKAFSMIPPVYCCMGEDFLTYFWLSFFAEKYLGIEAEVYNYFIDTGISSGKEIVSIEEWQKICSTASIFTILLNAVQEENFGFSAVEIEKIKEICRSYAANNLMQFEKFVVPALKNVAYEELCDWWGKNMIEGIKDLMENSSKENSDE